MRITFSFGAAITITLGLAVIAAPSVKVLCQQPEPNPPAVSAKDLTEFRARLLAATTRHLDQLLDAKSGVAALKGKNADGATALAYYQAFEVTGEKKYRAAAVELADRIVKAMKA